MTVPYKQWLKFDKVTLESYHFGTDILATDWTLKHLDTCRLGLDRIDTLAGGRYYEWASIFRPKANLGFESSDGMDQIVDVEFLTDVIKQINTADHVLAFDLIQGFVNNDNSWAHRWVNGKYYNGSAAWDAYPPGQHAGYNNETISTLEIGVGFTWLRSSVTSYMYSYKTGGGNGVEANRYQEDFFKGGAYFTIGSLAPSVPNLGQALRLTLDPLLIKVRYFNPVVNELGRYWVPTIGGVEVVLTGLGFNNDNDDLDGGGDSKPGGWDDLVDIIEFWRQQDTLWNEILDDDFYDGVRDPMWTDEPNNGTILEAGGKLTLSIAGGVNGDWWQPNIKNAAFATITPTENSLTVVTKLNSYTVNNLTNAGLVIGNTLTIPDDAGTYCYSFMRTRSVTVNGLEVVNVGVLGSQSNTVTTLPIWLRIRATSKSAPNTIYFDYSLDGASWTNLHSINDFTWSFIGLHVKNWGPPFAAIVAPFEFFKVNSGRPYVVLSRAAGDFTVDSNTQITIPSNKFPPLEAGSYILRLIKEDMDFSPRNSSIDIWSWAGDWRCTLAGLVSAGVRISILADDTPPKEARERGGSIILMDVEKKANTDGAITKEYYSQDVVRAPAMVYEGIIDQISSFRRGLDDKTGLFRTADCTVTLSNQNKKFSKLLATHFFKDQLATFYHAFIGEEESKKREIVRMVVEDYNIKGGSFELILKDISQKYLDTQLPRFICTDTELDEDDPDSTKFPYIHDSYVGDPMPEIFGLATYTGEEKKGAVEAIYVSTVSYRYLAAAGFLKEITEVYSDNALKTYGDDYVITQDDKYTYIDFTGDQGDNIITFNCKGYSFDPWDSDDGYIQNPAYIIAYTLIKLLKVPETLINEGSITTLAEKFEAMGQATSGILILQGRKTATEVLRELLISCGAKLWISKDGEFKLGRKDETSLATNLIVFEQFDLLDAPNRKMGLKKVVTGAKVYWGFVPVHDVFIGSKEVNRDDLEDDYGGEHTDRDRIRPPRPPRRRR